MSRENEKSACSKTPQKRKISALETVNGREKNKRPVKRRKTNQVRNEIVIGFFPENEAYDRIKALEEFTKERVKPFELYGEEGLHHNDIGGWEQWLRKYKIAEKNKVILAKKREQLMKGVTTTTENKVKI